MNVCFYIGYGASQKCEDIQKKAGRKSAVFDRSHYVSDLCGASDRALRGFVAFAAKACDTKEKDILIRELIELLDESRARDVSACLLPLLRAGKNVSVFADVSYACALPFVQEILLYLEKEGYTGKVLEVK